MQPAWRVFAVFCTVAIVCARLAELNANRHTLRGRVLETKSLKIFIIIGLLMAAGAIAESFWLARSIPLIPFVFGLILGFLSFRIRRRAIRSLGKFWSLNIEIREQHDLIRSGPFRAVRHPTYLSQILELFSFCFIMNAYYPLILFVGAFCPTMIFRIRKEEQAMLEKFGEDYRQYQQEVPMLLPKNILYLIK